jgi:hypothetical protein
VRSLFFAFLVFAFAAPALAQQPNAAGNQGGGQQAADKDAAKPRASVSATTHFSPGNRVDSSTYRAICDSPKDRDHADLCMQWRVAESSETQVIFTVLGFLALIGTLIFTAIAAVATRNTVSTMRDTGERQLRAYLTVIEGGCYRQSRALRFEFRPVILNTGQTPAYGVRVVSTLRMLSIQEAEMFDFTVPHPDQVLVSNTIGAHQNKFISTIAERRFTWAELREYRQGKRYIFVFGTVRYRDAFGQPRFTNFCFSIAAWSKAGPPLWHMNNRHNDSN